MENPSPGRKPGSQQQLCGNQHCQQRRCRRNFHTPDQQEKSGCRCRHYKGGKQLRRGLRGLALQQGIHDIGVNLHPVHLLASLYRHIVCVLHPRRVSADHDDTVFKRPDVYPSFQHVNQRYRLIGSAFP